MCICDIPLVVVDGGVNVSFFLMLFKAGAKWLSSCVYRRRGQSGLPLAVIQGGGKVAFLLVLFKAGAKWPSS